jgi:mono/diheme cytochrome c family protein
MGVIERDPHTGQTTTGHEWNGIKELNAPVPTVIYLFLACTVIFAVTWWVLMPTWPLGTTYTRGLLGVDQREIVTEKVKAATADRSVWTAQIAAKDFKDILADASLMRTVRATGHTLFGDNCAACHGFNAKGGRGLSQSDLGFMAVGRFAGGDRRDHSRRHQFGAPGDAHRADAGVRPRPDAAARRYRQGDHLRAEPVRSGRAACRGAGHAGSRQGPVCRQLRRLPRR